MNWKIVLCIAIGVFVAHLAIFMIIFRVHLDAHPPMPAPQPNFHVAEEKVTDPGTGEKLVHREMTVSTQLAPGIYQGRADERAGK
jgi:hypothetical protein